MSRRLAAAALAVAVLLPGCSRKGADIPPAEAAQAILEEVSFADTLVPAEAGAAENYYRLDDSVAEYAIYMSGTGATAEEIAVLKAADFADIADVEAILERRVQTLRRQFESYNPGEMAKLERPVVFRSGDTAVLVICGDTAGALRAVEALFQ